MTLYRGVTRYLPVVVLTGFKSEFIKFIGQGYVFKIPMPTIILIIATLIIWFISRKLFR